MTDESIIINDLIEEYDALDVLENDDAAQIIPETIDIIEVEGVEVHTISTQEAFSALGESNEQLVHSKLNGRYDSDQHPITAITGLRDELNSIEALQTVYSDSKGCANYYQWADGGSQDEDRLGRFVTFAQSEDISITHIKICTDGDVYGVTTTAAAFIGGQADTPRDYRYGLVAHSGIVAVRCEVDVKVGDYVISNQFGYAKKSNSDCGYKVYAIEEIHGAYYAVIDLKVPVGKLHKMASNLISLDGRVERAESNIVSAINTANEAYNKADKADNVSEEAVKKALEALGIATDTDTTVKELGEVISSSNQLMAEAKALADSAILSADAIRKEAVDTANKALTDVNDLIEDLKPITTWESEYGVGAEYLTTYIKDGLATKTEIQTVETLAEENKSAIEKNAEGFQTLVSSVDKYSVGEFSQAYGLNTEQAQTILKEGMVYIPTVNHSESYDEVEEFLPDINNNYIYTVTFGDNNKIEYHGLSETENGLFYLGNPDFFSSDSSDNSPRYCLFWDDASRVFILYTANTGNHKIGLSFKKNNDSADIALIDHKYYSCSGEKPSYEFDAITYIDPDKEPIIRDFTRGNYYIWTNTGWLETSKGVVFLSVTEPTKQPNILYWYTEDGSPDGYRANTLYIWESDDGGGYWKQVNVLSGNVTNRVVSMIRQTADSINAEVTNARGDAATLQLKISGMETSIKNVTSMMGSEEGKYNITAIEQTSTGGGSSIVLAVANKDGTKVLNGTSIVLSQGESGSYISLGGWLIEQNSFSYDTNDFRVVLRCPTAYGNANDGAYTVMSVYDKDAQKQHFRITSDGSMFATKGKIAGWEITDTHLGMTPSSGYPISISPGRDLWVVPAQKTLSCVVYSKGNFAVTTDGSMYANSGEIGGWDINSSYLGTSSGNQAFYIASASDNIQYWIRAYNSSSQQTFGVTRNGVLEATGANISGHIEATSGSFSGSVYASGGYFTGTINAGAVISNGVQLGTSSEDVYNMTVGNGSSAQSINIGFEGDNTISFNMSEASLFLRVINQETHKIDSLTMYRDSNGVIPYSTVFSAHNGKLDGTWYGTGSVSVTSDQNKKNTITSLDDKYEKLFDGLMGRTYKYNDGTSNRLHTGFIAQEVAHAISTANMDSSEFAGLVIKDNFDDTQDWYLRYEEFIALNTWQIQKLKSRVVTLEQELKELKSRLEI